MSDEYKSTGTQLILILFFDSGINTGIDHGDGPGIGLLHILKEFRSKIINPRTVATALGFFFVPQWLMYEMVPVNNVRIEWQCPGLGAVTEYPLCSGIIVTGLETKPGHAVVAWVVGSLRIDCLLSRRRSNESIPWRVLCLLTDQPV